MKFLKYLGLTIAGLVAAPIAALTGVYLIALAVTIMMIVATLFIGAIIFLLM
ncbi:hypothetical protein [Phreatobacter sp.]|uniref:hypothetical protein n=1 Tax=Phreatobacter sp. TaxID=1966341 RepID=UPI003F6EBC4C